MHVHTHTHTHTHIHQSALCWKHWSYLHTGGRAIVVDCNSLSSSAVMSYWSAVGYVRLPSSAWRSSLKAARLIARRLWTTRYTGAGGIMVTSSCVMTHMWSDSRASDTSVDGFVGRLKGIYFTTDYNKLNMTHPDFVCDWTCYMPLFNTWFD